MSRNLKIGIVCYPTFGGSGVIATEIGMAMARRGHKVHFICYDVPRRLDRFMENIYFHEVEVQEYPLFIHPPYSLTLASKIVEVSTYEKLDLLHVHYAVPHATSAFLARQVLEQGGPRIITTLHGTDITLVGQDRSFLPIVRFSIAKSDLVTTPSQYLKHATYDKLNLSSDIPIDVIPNFVDVDHYCPAGAAPVAKGPLANRCLNSLAVLVHVSNFRPVKRIGDIIKIFAAVNNELPAHLLLIGDGPERSNAEGLVRELKLEDRVSFLGKQESFVPLLQLAHLFLLPSESESFGLAALEAMSCGLPVIGSRVQGVPEVVIHGENGFLSDVGDVNDMAQNALTLLRDKELLAKFSRSARERAVSEFEHNKIIDRWEEYYLSHVDTKPLAATELRNE